MKAGMFTPRRGEVYSLCFIETKLYLRDAPSLCLGTPLGSGCIQTSHFTYEQWIAADPSVADTQWRYVRETHEWIPIFEAVNSGDVLQHVTVVEWPGYREPWIVPACLPRSANE